METIPEDQAVMVLCGHFPTATLQPCQYCAALFSSADKSQLLPIYQASIEEILKEARMGGRTLKRKSGVWGLRAKFSGSK
ncbi:hypothetical protein GLAREA_10329 [Glarea lozoyensis ATCC 20868]|uniref:Uncharacterized protein n=1 Tax=Glarea lozoyensis (strain ATCC 20868 / MF5171) TaxID=1116229 RepID=S3DA67_GLAL2|nr:uncharacterized protein GLAREA_10329 [Glarea lozoyensis ATCC 20868]EPE34635.1 hypothetical protein GLAREA_10329 [Glarea lozoyensis ATCC 20868]